MITTLPRYSGIIERILRMLRSPLGAARQVTSPLGAGRASGAAPTGNGLLNNLIAYWPGNEASGDALDLHTNALHLTDNNTVASDTGLVYALARQYVAVGERHTRPSDDVTLSTGDVDFTLAAWLYLDRLTDTMYGPCKWNVAVGGREYGLTYDSTTNRYRWLLSPDGSTSNVLLANTFGAVSKTTWYFVVCWHDAANNIIGISVNDINDTASYSSGTYDSPTQFIVGSTAVPSNYWSGKIGPTMFWKSAAGGGGVLTEAQRTALYNSGAGLTYAAFTT